MSKKESEFDRYDRMRKLEREAEVEKRKALGEIRKKGGRPKLLEVGSGGKNRYRNYGIAMEDDYYE